MSIGEWLKKICKETLNSDGQQNEQSPPPQIIEHKKDHDI